MKVFLQEKLGLDTEEITIERAHRIGKKAEGKRMIIIAKFLNYLQREKVLKKYKELKLWEDQIYINKLNCKSFTNYINNKIDKILNVAGLLCELSTLVPRQSLLTIYKSIIRPHLDYGDIIYFQPLNESLPNRIETVQYSETSQ